MFLVFLNKKKTLQFANTLGKCISVDRDSEDKKQNFLFLIWMKKHSHEGLSVETTKAPPGHTTPPPFIKKSNEHHKKTPKKSPVKENLVFFRDRTNRHSVIEYCSVFIPVLSHYLRDQWFSGTNNLIITSAPAITIPAIHLHLRPYNIKTIILKNWRVGSEVSGWWKSRVMCIKLISI